MLYFQSSDFELTESRYNLLRLNISPTNEGICWAIGIFSSGKTTLVLSKNLDLPFKSLRRRVLDSTVGFQLFFSSTSRATTSLPSNSIASGVLTSLTYSDSV